MKRIMRARTDSKTALIIAHPGHELRIWHWVEIQRPRVFVVTDGSGRSGTSRIETTGKLLMDSGAQPGGMFGEFTDKFLYQQTQSKNLEFFEYLSNRVATELIQHQIETVVGDAAEGIILAHDIVREVRRAAIRIAEQKLGRDIKHFEFPLDSHPKLVPPSASEERLKFDLTASALARKLAVARNYPELSVLVDESIDFYGEEAFQQELLFVPNDHAYLANEGGVIGYETHGKQMVKESQYKEVLLFKKHVQPIVTFLDQLHSFEAGKCVNGVS